MTLAPAVVALFVGTVVIACSSSTSTPSADASTPDASVIDGSSDTSTKDASTVDGDAADAEDAAAWKSTGKPCHAGYVCCQGLYNDIVGPSRCVNGVAECPSDYSNYVYVPPDDCLGARDAKAD